jgi:hypothetical protein
MEKTSQKDQAKPLVPVEKTYGEKVHHFVFDELINFWATLAISGLFTFWVKHSTVPLPKTFFQGKLPSEFHGWVRERFAGSPIVNIFPAERRAKVGEIMADALTINLPGTATILPSVWLGAKVKTPMVEWLDRRHYGIDADDDPRIRERHLAIENERKPTLLGAVLARLTSMTASVMTGWAIGAPDNLVQQAGKNNEILKEFPGIDHYAGKMGAGAGDLLAKASPGFNKFTNRAFTKAGIDWTAANKHADQTYASALQGWLKYTSLDIMYTTVTSSTIHPIINLLKHVPFMSYKEKPREHRPLVNETCTSSAAETNQVQIDMRGDQPEKSGPRSRVEKIEKHETVKESQEEKLATLG